MAKFALGVATGYIFADIIDVFLDKVKSYGHEASTEPTYFPDPDERPGPITPDPGTEQS